MSKVVVIHQPDFLPYLGFFHRFLIADIWVVLDNVQFVSGCSKSWHNRDKIKTRDGEKWLTVSVKKCPRGTKINEVELSMEVDWRENNINLIEDSYGEAPFYKEISPYIERLYGYECERLIDFNMNSIEMLMELFDIRIETRMASALRPEGKSNELLVDIIKKVNGTVYLSGVGARDYFDPAPFDKAGIEVIWQDFTHPEYPQLHGEFIPYLSSIDLLFNCGIERSRKILKGLV